jgi:hypothetical protein
MLGARLVQLLTLLWLLCMFSGAATWRAGMCQNSAWRGFHHRHPS